MSTDMSDQQLELARLLRTLTVGEGHWDGSVWVHDPAWTAEWKRRRLAGEDPGPYGKSWVWVQDYAFDWRDLSYDPDGTQAYSHIPHLGRANTEGAVLEMLRDEGFPYAYARPVVMKLDPKEKALGWVAFTLTDDARVHVPIEPNGPIYDTAVEAIGNALVYVRSVRAASRATTRSILSES